MNSGSGRSKNPEEIPYFLPPRERLGKGGAPDSDVLDLIAESGSGVADTSQDIPHILPRTTDTDKLPEDPTDEDEPLTAVALPTKPDWSLTQKTTLCAMTLGLFLVVVLYVTHSVHSYAARLWELSAAYCYVYIAALILLIVGLIVWLLRYWWSYHKTPSLVRLRRKLEEEDPAQELEIRREVEEWVGSLKDRKVISSSRYETIIDNFKEAESQPDWLENLRKHLLHAMDTEAKNEIEREATAVGVLTALSPYGLIDSVFILWRNTRLVLRVAKIYGSRPGWWGNLRLLRRVLTNVALGAATQEVMDWYYTTLGGKATGVAGRVVQGLGDGVVKAGGTTMLVEPATGGVALAAGMALKSLGGLAAELSEQLVGPLLQGFLSGLLTIRMGLAAQRECRLLAMSEPEGKKCSASLLSSLWNIFPSGKKSSESAKQDQPEGSTSDDE